MKKSKKGQLIFYGIAMAMIIFVAVVQLLNPTKDVITEVRNETNLNCTDPNVDHGVAGTCVFVGSYLWGFAGIGIFVALAYLTGRKLKQT